MHFFQQIAVSSWDSGLFVTVGLVRVFFWEVGRLGGVTGLDAGALLLVGEELAQLGLVLVVELVDVGLVDAEVGGGRHFGGWGLPGWDGMCMGLLLLCDKVN